MANDLKMNGETIQRVYLTPREVEAACLQFIQAARPEVYANSVISIAAETEKIINAGKFVFMAKAVKQPMGVVL